MNIAIVGAGTIGSAWALVFASGGHAVRIWDPAPAAAGAALDHVRTQLDDLCSAGLSHEAPDVVLSRISVAPSLKTALEAAWHVQENGPENLETRRRLFVDLDEAAPPEAVLASSTSGMPPSSFTETLKGRRRCLVAHPANPPSLLPLVELCPAPWTDAASIERTRELMTACGRKVALLKREAEGFLLNRLQGALLAEAFRLVADGVAGPGDIDSVVKYALGLRWSFMGPFETIDLNAPGGIADFCERYGSLYERIQQQMQPRPWGRELVDAIAADRRADFPMSKIPLRQTWRDRRLMALAAHLAAQPQP